ncbi:MAG: hypothetical protein HUU37_01720 [Bdellovibrionales bacterium]|nr:hypothetical protein [Bdellovibrionales bacterium]
MMTEIIKLLEQRNSWIAKYLKANEAFLAALSHAPEMAIEELDFFYGNRESLLKIIGSLDQRIRNLLDKGGALLSMEDSAVHTKTNRLLREKDSMVAAIVAMDEKIISGLERLRQENEGKISKLAKGKKALAKYRSSHKHNDKIDKQV